MWPLIKRDLLSLRPIAVLFSVIFVAMTSFLIWFGTHDIEDTGFIGLIFLIVFFFSYGLIAQICQIEEANQVHNRVRHFPISEAKIVLSRYLTVLLIMLAQLMILSIVFLLSFFVKGKPLSELVIDAIVLQVPSLIFLFLGVYFAFYYSLGANAASWAIRSLVVVGIIFLVLYEGYVFNALAIEGMGKSFYLLFFASCIICFILSYLISVKSYRSYYSFRAVSKSLATFVASVLILFTIVFLVATPLAKAEHLALGQKMLDAIEVKELYYQIGDDVVQMVVPVEMKERKYRNQVHKRHFYFQLTFTDEVASLLRQTEIGMESIDWRTVDPGRIGANVQFYVEVDPKLIGEFENRIEDIDEIGTVELYYHPTGQSKYVTIFKSSS